MAYTNEQLMQKLRNAHNAGDTYAAKRFAEMIRANEKPAEPEQEKGLVQSASDMVTGADRETEQSMNTEEFNQGKLALLASGLNPDIQLGELLANPKALDQLQDSHKSKLLSGDFKGFLSDALGQFVTPLTTSEDEVAKISQSRMPNLQRTKDEKGNEYLTNPDSGYSVALNKPGFSARDAVNLGANTAAFATGGLASTVPRAIAKDALIQSGIEGAQALSGGDFSPEDVALAGGISGAGKLAENAIGGAYRLATGKVSDDAAKQIADIEAQGLKARTQDVVQPKTLLGKMAANVGELNPLTAGQQAAQQRTRQDVAETFVDKFTPSYDDIKSSITGKRKRIETAAVNAMDSALSKASSATLSKQNTVDAIESEIKRLTELPNGQPRTMVDESTVNTLSGYLEDVKNASSVTDLRDLRTNLRDSLSPKFGEKSNTKEGAIKRIYGAMTRDMDETVKGAVTPREFAQYKRGSAVYGREAEKLKKGRIKKVLQAGDDLSPEQIDRNLLSKDSVVRGQLYNSLDSAGRENARAAIIRKLADDASRGGGLSVNMFLKKLRDNDEALQTFFRGRDRKELEGLRNALEATRSAQDAAVNPNTGQRLAPYLVGGGAIADLGLTIAGTLGSAIGYKAYQSKPVRNALLKLANTPKGSSAFEKTLSDLNSALLPFVQSSTSTE